MANEEWIYYHALYHFVTHWGAYLATLVMLLTIGIILSTSSVVRNRLYFIIVIIIAGAGSWFFLWRMNHFGIVVNQKLGEYPKTTMWIPYPWNLIIGGILTFGMVIMDLIVLFRRRKPKD